MFDGNYCIANGFDGGTVEILDGTFYSKEATIVLGGVEIFGGSFNHNVDDYLADSIEMKLYNGLYYTGNPYKITVVDTENGTVDVISEYVLKNIKVTNGEGQILAVANGEFVMPSSNVTVAVSFEADTLVGPPTNRRKRCDICYKYYSQCNSFVWNSYNE